MFEFEVNEGYLLERQKAIEAALSTSREAEKVLRKIIRKYVLEARAEVVKNIKFKDGDPREAARAVRTTVYRRVLDANINILTGRKKHGESSYVPPRKGVSGRGGNRRTRTTLDRGKYDALDRGFILRWLNSGVKDRAISFTQREGRKTDKWNKHPNTGNRGSIAARNFFKPLSDQALGKMRDNLAAAIETELLSFMNEKK